VNLIDDAASSAWACPEGKIANNVFVFEMVAPAALSAFEFDTGAVDGDGRGAKDVIVEVSPISKEAGFERVLQVSLADKQNAQRFPALKSVQGTWVRLTIVNNHGDEKWTELCGFRGQGLKLAPPPPGAVSGTYGTNYGNFHIRQQGTAITGCYEHDDGLFTGTMEGRIAKLTWTQGGGSSRGPAIFVFTPDSKSFRGYWWYTTDKDRPVDGDWTGTRISGDVGGCPHWSGSVGGELKKDLAATGRALTYDKAGIYRGTIGNGYRSLE